MTGTGGDGPNGPSVKRSPSGDAIVESTSNSNVSWINYRGIWTFYVTAIVLFYFLSRFVLDALGLGAYGWNVTHICHGLITSFNLHFRQGTADSVLASEDFGAYEGLTFWEQVEAGVPWTSTKKFFMVAPLVLVYLAGAECNFEPTLVAVNVFIMGFEIIPKFPGMHKVRLFGWNDQKVD